MATVVVETSESNSVREIHKNGWLKAPPVAPEKRPSPFSKPQKAEKVWVVFCIHDDAEPFLEMYENRRSAYSHNPLRTHSLLSCHHVSPTIAVEEGGEHEFAVTLGSSVVRLCSPTHEEMMDWIEMLSSKLRDLGILQPKSNVYSREPTSPLHFSARGNRSASLDQDERSLQQASRDPNSPLPPVPSPSHVPSVVPRRNVFSFDTQNRFVQSHSSPNSPTVYEALFPHDRVLANSRRRSASDLDPTNPRPQREALSWNCPTPHGDNTETLPSEEGPPAYEPLQRTRQPLSLKEMQVAALKKEMTHESGVRIVLRKRDCVSGIAFVDCFGSVWVAGWKQKDHPLLHSTFHIGDRVLSVAGKKVSCVSEVHKAVKHRPLMVEFVVMRLPHGRVFALKREYEGRDLGFVREGTTAEIREVDPNGLAARSGLSRKASTVDGRGVCSWMLTEVNNRPLNLCFKDNEVHERLNAVGRDISILVQPSELVLEIKKQLKSLRSYKDYLVQ